MADRHSMAERGLHLADPYWLNSEPRTAQPLDDDAERRRAEDEVADRKRYAKVSATPAVAGAKGACANEIKATPFGWPSLTTIPPRPWVYGRWFLRNTITAVVAPGGVGKSSLMASTILALASGKELLGKTSWGGPKCVWYWNLEDDGDELARQISAAAKYHGVTECDCEGRLFVDSGLDGATLCTAVQGERGVEIIRPVIEALVSELRRRSIDVLIVDPFVSSHSIPENDNGAIDAVAKEWARVAKRASCSVVLVHHTKKLAGGKVTLEGSRGAVALTDATRSALVLNRMDEIEAKALGVDDDGERRRIFSVQDDKASRAPAAKADWYRIASVDLGNGEDGHGDSVGVVTMWTPPDLMDGVTDRTLHDVQKLVALKTEHERYRVDAQAASWVGKAVAEVLGISSASDAKADRAKINRLLKLWLANGALVKVEGRDLKRNDRIFIEVGHWADTEGAPLAQI